jgi:hypothetical protein
MRYCDEDLITPGREEKYNRFELLVIRFTTDNWRRHYLHEAGSRDKATLYLYDIAELSPSFITPGGRVYHLMLAVGWQVLRLRFW